VGQEGIYIRSHVEDISGNGEEGGIPRDFRDGDSFVEKAWSTMTLSTEEEPFIEVIFCRAADRGSCNHYLSLMFLLCFPGFSRSTSSSHVIFVCKSSVLDRSCTALEFIYVQNIAKPAKFLNKCNKPWL